MASDRVEHLIGEIQHDAHACAQATGIPDIPSSILEAIRSVPREHFVPEPLRAHAWDNRPLPIGYDQTISQPFIVALMTALLEPQRGDRVLEVGTGCGYQAAVLALLVKDVYTIEVVEPLAGEAAKRLKPYANVHTKVGDGYHGWQAHAPYPGIIVTAGADSIPPALIEQLAAPGKLVIPGAVRAGVMDLLVIEKSQTGELSQRSTIPVAFVPFTRADDEAQ